MKRYVVSLAILIVGLFWVSVGAPVWGGQSLLEPSRPTPQATPDPYDPTLFPYSPERDARVTEILSKTEAVNGMLAGRELGRDYWIRVSYVYDYKEARNSGEKPIAMVDIYFDPPLSFSGEVPVYSDPCSGHYGEDERLEPDDPCMAAPKEYGSAHQSFTDAQVITTEVDLRRGEVVQVFQSPTSASSMEYIKGRYAR
jgi:hypothetical protein